MINRKLAESIRSNTRNAKVTVLLGARQVGKTTLISALTQEYSKVLTLNCDDYEDIVSIEGKSSTELKNLLFQYDMVFSPSDDAELSSVKKAANKTVRNLGEKASKPAKVQSPKVLDTSKAQVRESTKSSASSFGTIKSAGAVK